MVEMIVLIVVFGGLVYFMMIRPMKKQQQQQAEMQQALGPGARVLMQNGMIGTIRAMGDKQMVVELAPGTEVTVLKQVVARVLKPEEEEFEYSDELEPGDIPAALEAGPMDSEIEIESNDTTEDDATESDPETSTQDEAAKDKKPEEDSGDYLENYFSKSASDLTADEPEAEESTTDGVETGSKN
jgi:preprotein translocase subunit YajC